eukprot:scaffold52117_cov55-Cyclotella_meneghiniana.AAC.1
MCREEEGPRNHRGEAQTTTERQDGTEVVETVTKKFNGDGTIVTTRHIVEYENCDASHTKNFDSIERVEGTDVEENNQGHSISSSVGKETVTVTPVKVVKNVININISGNSGSGTIWLSSNQNCYPCYTHCSTIT